jgi:hypothetical protein
MNISFITGSHAKLSRFNIGQLSIADSELTILIKDRKFSVQEPVITMDRSKQSSFFVEGKLGTKHGVDHTACKLEFLATTQDDLQKILWVVAHHPTMDIKAKKQIAQKYLRLAYDPAKPKN